MQCPFSFKTKRNYCKTGAFGLMVPYGHDYKRYCCNRSYYLCKIYQANTGIGDPEKCRTDYAERFIHIKEDAPAPEVQLQH